MKRLVFGACVVAGFVVVAASSAVGSAVGGAGAGAGGDNQKNPAEGVWLVVGMERSGAKVADDVVKKLDMKLTVMGQSYTVTVNGNVVDKGTSKIDYAKTPNTVDSKSEEDPGKTVLGIRQVKGDSMKACYCLEGKSRPAEFATKEGSGHVLILYRRVR